MFLICWSQAMRSLRKGASSADAAVLAISILEVGKVGLGLNGNSGHFGAQSQ